MFVLLVEATVVKTKLWNAEMQCTVRVPFTDCIYHSLYCHVGLARLPFPPPPARVCVVME